MSATPDWFIEIQKPKEVATLPERIDCYILVNIDPKCCGTLAKDLNAILPLRSSGQSDGNTITGVLSQEVHQRTPFTDHLKRIRRRPATAGEIDALIQTAVDTAACEETASNDDSSTPSSKSHQEAPKKRAKKNEDCKTSRNWSLDMLVGSAQAVDDLMNEIGDESTNSKPNSLESILAKYNMTTAHLTRRALPGRPAETKEELQQWNTGLWPTLFFEKKTEEYKEEEMQLSKEEQITMLEGMNAAIVDALAGRLQWAMCLYTDEVFKHCVKGVIVLNPQKGPIVSRDNGSIVSRGCDERQLQAGDVGAKSNFPDRNNPMCTSAILAIQGVSRNERENAVGHGMESTEFQRGQYLCTGYDVFLTKEPNAYEAMALVHSRVRRVVFGIVDTQMGGLGGVSNEVNGIKGGIHCLPGTNHHYRAFRMNMDLPDAKSEDPHASLRRKVINELKDLHPNS